MITTNISWASHTWSPWRGCEHATLPDGSEHPGCTNCYAEAMSKRNPKSLGEWGPDGRRVLNANWDGLRRWNKAARSAGERRRVFPSLCDPFEEWDGQLFDSKGHLLYRGASRCFTTEKLRPTGQRRFTGRLSDVRSDFFAIIDECACLDFLLLTKRPQNILKMWQPIHGMGRCAAFPDCEHPDCRAVTRRENVWLILSASTQADLDANIPALLACRHLVPVLGLSLEPLLSHVHIEPHLTREYEPTEDYAAHNGIDWVIVGGESGPHARQCPDGAIESIVEQCRAAGVAAWCKQDSGRLPGKQGRIPDEIWNVKELPELQRSRD